MTAKVMNSPAKLRGAVQWLCQSLTLDVDARVHVFEVTIRALGGLLSTHVMLERRPSAVPGYNGCLLRLAVDLANRLLPAFDTASGIPLSWVHLQKGVLPGETRFTCTACAATLLLEFGTLSRLTGNQTYEQKAKHAMKRVFGMRSPVTGLLGNTLHTDNQEWLRKDSGIGAGIDSFYEYLLKSVLPLMPLTAHDAILLRQRRCTACLQTQAELTERRFVCLLEVQQDKLQCSWPWRLHVQSAWGGRNC
ncbi:hypothetical protein WJX77_012277 [Trebouxia sp. C0004]